MQKLKELIRKRTLKPFAVVLIVFSISQFSGMQAMRPYIVLILSKYGTPISPSWATVALGITGMAAALHYEIQRELEIIEFYVFI